METNFNFKSQICTSREQSERLLALGLKKETADMCHTPFRSNGDGTLDYTEHCSLPISKDIPAWSLHRLLSILNEDDSIMDITIKDGRYGIHCGYDTEWYDDLYDGIIATFDTLIKEGYFNKEYLK